MSESSFAAVLGGGALIATAIHDGHRLKPELRALTRLSEQERLREEDPFTALFTCMAPTGIVVSNSRFQVDLNRPRSECVYLTPAQAWGLEVWTETPSSELLASALDEYDQFYTRVREVCDEKVRTLGGFVLFDLHSYNHRRDGPHAPPAPAAANPEINLGTGSVPADRSREPIEAFLRALREQKASGRALDVRENVRFRGGHLARWVHQNYPRAGLALAIEVKKFFMDEWTGAPNERVIAELRRALLHAASAVEKVL